MDSTPRLRPCPRCAQHIKVAERTCPHCRVSASGALLVPAVLGLFLAGCNKNEAPTTPPEPEAGDGETVAEPMYGVPMTDDDLSDPPADDAEPTEVGDEP